MKFRDSEGNEMLFDDLPKVFNPTQLVFFTHLHHLNGRVLQMPLKMPKIYTTDVIAKQLMTDYSDYFHEEHFHLLIPYEPQIIRMYDGKEIIVMACDEDVEVSFSEKLMILIKKPDNEIYFFAGLCTEYRQLLMSDTFAHLLADGIVTELIVHLIPTTCSKAWATESFSRGTHTDALIDEIEKFRFKNKICLIIPRFGYEPLIGRIAYCYRRHVAVHESYHQLLLNEPYFSPNAEKSFIQIIPDESAASSDRLIIHIGSNTRTSCNGSDGNDVYSWSPFPTAFELLVLIKLLKPRHIVNSCNDEIFDVSYLREYSELLKKHPTAGKGKYLKPMKAPYTPKVLTPPSATTATLSNTIETLPAQSIDPPPSVQSGTIDASRLSTSPLQCTLKPYVMRKRQLEYADESSSSSN